MTHTNGEAARPKSTIRQVFDLLIGLAMVGFIIWLGAHKSSVTVCILIRFNHVR